MKGYKLQMKEFIGTLDSTLTPSEKREALEGWKRGYWAADQPDRPYEGKEGVNISEGDFSERVKPTSSPRRKPKLTPYEADPNYHDLKEPIHGSADLQGVKQYPVFLKEESADAPPIKVKSVRLQRSVDILELKVGYDHITNRHVLYSPLKYNERWDRQSQVVWLRIIGMTPKKIAKRLDIKYDTVKNWLRALKNQPLVAASQYDWAVRQVEGRGEYSSKFSGVEAKPRPREAI